METVDSYSQMYLMHGEVVDKMISQIILKKLWFIKTHLRGKDVRIDIIHATGI